MVGITKTALSQDSTSGQGKVLGGHSRVWGGGSGWKHFLHKCKDQSSDTRTQNIEARQAWWLPVIQAREVEIVNWPDRLGVTGKFWVQYEILPQ